MSTFTQIIERLGAAGLGTARRWADLARLAASLAAAALDRQTYNSAVRDILFKQIYFTAVQVLPVFVVLALILNGVVLGIVVSLARDYGMMDYATNVALGFVGLELTPFFAATLVALRSGSAINSEVALMCVNREVDALRQCGIDPVAYELFPRVAGGIISLGALACVGLVVTLAVTFVVVDGGDLANFAVFSQGIGDALSVADVAGLACKSAVFGLCVTLIPVATGMDTARQFFAVPISVLRGMMRVFLALFLVEITSLILKYV